MPVSTIAAEKLAGAVEKVLTFALEAAAVPAAAIFLLAGVGALMIGATASGARWLRWFAAAVFLYALAPAIGALAGAILRAIMAG